MHLYNQEALVECFNAFEQNKAVGVDEKTKRTYRADCCSNIAQLIAKMKAMAYRLGPVREVLIPKEEKPGATRPLAISNPEDKIVQKMT